MAEMQARGVWLGSVSRKVVAVAAATVMAGWLASMTPAAAQFYGGFGYRTFSYPAYGPPPVYEARPVYGVRAGEIAGIVAEEGFVLVAPPRLNGLVWLADVSDRRGGRQRLVIDARSGDIVQSFVLGAPRPADGFSDGRRVARTMPGNPRVIPGIDGDPNEDTSAPANRQSPPRATRPVQGTAPTSARPPSKPAATSAARAEPASPTNPRPEPRKAPRKPASDTAKAVPAPPVADPLKAQPAPVVPAQGQPAPPVTAAAAPRGQPVMPASPTAPSRVNDIPVAPLDDATPRKPSSPVNDIPVAPLE